MKKSGKKYNFKLTLIFSVIIFLNFLLTVIIVGVLTYILVKTGVIDVPVRMIYDSSHLILFLVIMSTVLGFIIAAFTGNFIFKPIHRIINSMNKLSSGNYSARIKFGKTIKDFEIVRDISESFNTMAEELENTEMLRSDFINNFSHEFKTPIVSIAGFAKLLKKGNLTEEQKKEYVDIIEEESLRLSYMATNVLNLTRVENQTILSDVSLFNLSEQIRSCILLLENKWSNKHIDLHIDFGEFYVRASEELLKQVWINLIDNAIKFSPEYGLIEITISNNEKGTVVKIKNTGEKINESKMKKIFNKFYQADESHSSEGNGIGLAIVKRVTELHKGSVSVESDDSFTTFTVKLPAN